MSDTPAAPRGRPFRALAGLLLLFMLWLGWRWPLMGARVGEVTALLLPPRAAGPPLVRVMAAGHRAPAGPRPVPGAAAPAARPAPVLRPPPPAQPPAIRVATAPTATEPAAPPAAAPEPAPIAAPAPAAPRLSGDPAFRLAQSAYDRLRAGQRRQAAALFDAALALQPGNRQWQADRGALGRRWQLGGFALLRDGGSAQDGSGPAASPVLGGGQIGGSVAVLADPYARRPLALVVRANVAADAAGVRAETAQAAIGLRQALAPGVSISAERLVAIGHAARGDWTLRLAGGGAIGGMRGRLSAYGEAGVLGSGEAYAGAQASARILSLGPATLNAGSWASLQTGPRDVWRVDVGPSLSAQVKGVRVAADWRQRVAGNAAPGSGPAVTISAGF